MSCASAFPTKRIRGERRNLGTLQPLAWRIEVSQSRFVSRVKGQIAKCVASEPDSPESEMKLQVAQAKMSAYSFSKPVLRNSKQTQYDLALLV